MKEPTKKKNAAKRSRVFFPNIETALKKYNEDMKQYIGTLLKTSSEDFQRHVGALSEDFQGKVAVVAEQVVGTADKVDGLVDKVDGLVDKVDRQGEKLDEVIHIQETHTEMIGVIMEDVSEIKIELKTKADKTEVARLERRVLALEQ